LGNGFIVKGADVAIEAIRSFPSTELVICGPYKADEVFWSTYKSEIKKHHSVKGFITIGSRAYWEIVRYATWQFHFSAAEGCATSLTTLMQSGVIPISNRESGLMVEGQGVDIVDSGNLVQDAVLALHQATSMTTQEIQEARTCLYEKAPRFSQVQFRLQFIDLVKAWEEKLQSR